MDDLKDIHRGFDVVTAFINYMGIDHGRFEVFVAEELLDSADVVAVLQ